MIPDYNLQLGDAVHFMRRLPDASIDALITDPPYAEIDREYGRWTEAEWRWLMCRIVVEARRVLKPTGSALFIIQANQEKVGRTRAWAFEFQLSIAREWNLIQDLYWWNHAATPTVHAQARHGLTRPAVKLCVWAGDPVCFRNQDAVLWTVSDAQRALKWSARAERYSQPSGQSMNRARVAEIVAERGGVTPFNLIPIPNVDSRTSAGAEGHGAGTPLKLCEWFARYLTPPGGLILDPFMGSGTMGIAAMRHGFHFAGIEKEPGYFEIAERRIREAHEAASHA